MELKKRLNRVPIRQYMILYFILAMILTQAAIGFWVYFSWVESARDTTQKISRSMNDSIYQQIDAFVEEPMQLLRSHQQSISSGTLQLGDTSQRDPYFVYALNAYTDPIYSFAYGSEQGEYYGARRNPEGLLEIMKNDGTTGGHSWYYQIREDLNAGKFIVDAGPFDPRTRPWYQAAKKEGKPVFSPVYKHFVMPDLSISAAWPIYDEQGVLEGVLGAHMLLSGINQQLERALEDYEGYSIIVEKSTGNLIGDSMGLPHFKEQPDGSWKMVSIQDLENQDILKAYQQYSREGNSRFVYEAGEDKLHVSVREFHKDGLDWLILSGIREDMLLQPVLKNIQWTLVMAILGILLAILLYWRVTRRLMAPISSLVWAAESLAKGNLSQRAPVQREDEIGKISASFNHMANELQALVGNLEETVYLRTQELHQANEILTDNRNQLHLILNSTAEGIYGMDNQGACTFINNSGLQILGYDTQEELLGRNMHESIHYAKVDGTRMKLDECKIFKAFAEGKGISASDEVFWRKDGTSFAVEYHSYPQFQEGRVVGAVVTFMDISDRKKRESDMENLRCHDVLTGLHNRRCFEENIDRLDKEEHLPLSLVFADVNGLKMANDIFGHRAGDQLIIETANILRDAAAQEENWIAARVGGDEFILIMPRADGKRAEEVVARIREKADSTYVSAIKCSISLGVDTKTSRSQPLEEIMANAEDAMYRNKALNRKNTNAEIIDTIIQTLHERSREEERHSRIVSQLSGDLGRAMGLPEPDIKKLKRAGYLHDIGKIVLEEQLLHKKPFAEEDLEKMKQHPVVGYRILNLFDDTLDLAEPVYSHHERWNGTGYPRGLRGEEIPLLARILAVTETYDRVLNRGEEPLEIRTAKARQVIEEDAGIQFDPAVVDAFLAWKD